MVKTHHSRKSNRSSAAHCSSGCLHAGISNYCEMRVPIHISGNMQEMRPKICQKKGSGRQRL